MSRAQTVFGGKLVWLAIGLLAGLYLATFMATTQESRNASASQHGAGINRVTTDIIKVDLVPGTSRSKSEVWIYGSGYLPGQEITVLVSDGNGVLSDISTPLGRRRDGGGSVRPLVANEDGAWATSWRLGRFTRNNIGNERMASILVVDAQFNDLGSTPIAFCNISGRADFAEANPDATEVTLAGFAEAVTDALEANGSATIAYYISPRLVEDALAAALAGVAPEGNRIIVGGDFVLEDDKIEVRIGDNPLFGYPAGTRPNTAIVDIVMEVELGDTLVFNRLRQSGSRSTMAHRFTIEGMGIDILLDDGRHGSDPPGGTVGDSDDPDNNFEITFTKPGEFPVTDSTPGPHGPAGGDHGNAKFVVTGELAPRFPDGTVVHADDLEGTADLTLIVVPEWCSTSPVGERDSAA